METTDAKPTLDLMSRDQPYRVNDSCSQRLSHVIELTERTTILGISRRASARALLASGQPMEDEVKGKDFYISATLRDGSWRRSILDC